MDERTRRTADEATPGLRPTAPAPVVERRLGGGFRVVIGIIVLIAFVVGAYLLFRSIFNAPSSGGSRFSQGAQSIGVASVGQGDIRVVLNALGTVTPIATINVQTQIDGQIMAVPFTEGQIVNKGDTLAQIDDRPYRLQQAQYEGQLARDQGVLAQAQVDLARYQKLAEQNSIARQQYEDQIYIVQQNEGTVKLDQAQIDQQKLNIVYCHIVSPVTGRVGIRLVDPGNYVQASTSTLITVVTQMQPITVIFPIPEDELPNVMPQLSAGTALQVAAYDRANVKLLATGRVIALDSQIDTTTGTVKVRAQFDNSDNALFPNQFVNAQLLLNTLHSVITVPTAAIQRGAPGTYVYVVNGDSTVSVRPVKVGSTDGAMTEVNSGLSVGERVVIDGTDRLRDGAHVTVPGASGQPPGGAAARGGQSQGSDHSQNRRNSGSK
jgi:membrane fusion protein, multidrug efflux system